MIPHHRAKFSADYSVTSALTIGADLIVVGPRNISPATSSNQFPQLPAYAVVNADASYQVTSNILTVYLKCGKSVRQSLRDLRRLLRYDAGPELRQRRRGLQRPARAEPGAPPLDLCRDESHVLRVRASDAFTSSREAGRRLAQPPSPGTKRQAISETRSRPNMLRRDSSCGPKTAAGSEKLTPIRDPAAARPRERSVDTCPIQHKETGVRGSSTKYSL